MLSTLAKRLLEQHYVRIFEPLTDVTVSLRRNTPPGCPDLYVARMLSREPDGRLMQVLATIGASEFRLPREKGIPANRNEYVTFVPADWNMDDPHHRWVMDMLADISDFTAEVRSPFYYAHTLDMTESSSLSSAGADFNMAGAVLLAPLNNEDEQFMTCRTGLMSRVNIIHMMPVTAQELKQKPSELIRKFYPASGEMHFLCARSRS